MNKMMFLAIALFAQNLFAKTPAEVTYGQPQCYGREYSETHMKGAPLQTVKKMDVKFYKYNETEEGILLDISTEIKKDGSYKPYSTSMFCTKESKTSLRCGIECDGGSAVISWNVKTVGSEILLTNNGFVMYGGCGEDVEEDDMIWLDNLKGGDDVFKLYALPAQYCVQ